MDQNYIFVRIDKDLSKIKKAMVNSIVAEQVPSAQWPSQLIKIKCV